MRASSYKALIAALCAVLLGELCVFGFLVYSAQSKAAEIVAEVQTEEITVADKPLIVIEPPLYYQADERWGGLPYATAESDIAESGCGLCAAASAAAYLTGKDYIDPPYLLNLIGNRCIDGGVNHMGLFCQELQALYGVEYQDLWSLEDAEAYLRDGWMLFAGMGGSVYEGGREYESHVLLVWKCDAEGVYIRDSADVNLATPITWEQFEEINWSSYFYAIREGQE